MEEQTEDSESVKPYGVLYTFEERQQIEELLKLHLTYEEIGKKMGRGKNSIRHEVSKFGKIDYTAEKAHERFNKRYEKNSKKGKPASKFFNLEERQKIELGIKQLLTTNHIGKILGRTQGSIKNEIQRHGGRLAYNAEIAQNEATIAAKSRVEKLESYISPEKDKISFEDRLNGFEMQVEIILDLVKQIKEKI